MTDNFVNETKKTRRKTCLVMRYADTAANIGCAEK
jgi:hypothetical protein